MRIVAIDVFRGFTIVLMTIVNNPGSWNSVYGPLLHAEWHGWTPTDLVFPFFLFIVGVVIPIAIAKQVEKGLSKGALSRRIVKRAGILFLIGLFLAAFPFFHFDPSFGLRESLTRIRIFGVLQRIALGYLFAALLYVYLSKRSLIVLTIIILIAYYLAMTFIPVPGHGAGLLDLKEWNLAAFIDRMIVGEDHLWTGAGRRWDPEGLLSTIPAVATALIGVLAGYRFTEGKDLKDICLEFFSWGFVLLSLGYLWGWAFPINKALWTSSYVLFTGGIALLGLAFCIWIVDIMKFKKGVGFFSDFGINAITVYAGTSLLAQIYGILGLSGILYSNVFSHIISPKFGSLLSALSWVAFWYAILVVMRRKDIRISI